MKTGSYKRTLVVDTLGEVNMADAKRVFGCSAVIQQSETLNDQISFSEKTRVLSPMAIPPWFPRSVA